MTLFRALFIILIGIVFGLFEWFVLTVFPVSSVLRLSLIVVSIILMRQYVSSALLFGMSALFVFDVGGYMVFPIHTVSFLLCVLIIMLLFNYFVTHRAFFGYVLGGLIIIIGHRLFVGVLRGLLTDVTFSEAMVRYPGIWIEALVSVSVYTLVVLWLYRRLKVIHVEWPKAA